jgi:predicted nuclease of restriction endonuclease-like (RecB) superfamily
MRKFAEFVNDEEKVHTVSALLSWSHNRRLFDKTETLDEYLWYAQQTIGNGWSLSSLEYYLTAKTYLRQELAEKSNNYKISLPSPLGGLASDTLKDPFVFDFIRQREGIIEREIEHEMVTNIAKTIMELGTGFAFVGNQYRIEVSDKEYYMDLLFYNTRLRCYVVIELKNTEFKPEYAGKLNFYLSAVDDIMKHETDNPSIGIMLCRTKDRLTAEYALKDINKPIGISEYKLSDYVPDQLADMLPSIRDIEKRVRMEFDLTNDDHD